MSEHDVAIVGMSCVFPGAVDLRQFWYNIVNGVDSVSEIPPGRWHYGNNNELPPDHDAYVACSRGGFLPSEFRVDPTRYGVFPNLVREGDADQFLTLHVVEEALRDADIAPDAPVRRRTDLVMGRGGYPSNRMVELAVNTEIIPWVQNVLAARFPEFSAEKLASIERELRRGLPKDTADNISTLIPNLTVSRAANRLDLRGAAYTVDAACASSLIAVEQLIHRLRLGLCDVGVAGGISLNQNPGFWFIFTQLGAISPAGEIRPFDRRASGTVLAEGAGAVVLKRLADAQRDGDRVYAVIKGVGSSSDGRDAGVLAPATPGQVESLRQAYRDARIDPSTIGYLEAHGTATVVGDLIEINTIKAIFGTDRGCAEARPMGSVKSMIGHAIPAAGIAALIKTALTLSNKIIPASLHCEEPHPALEGAPFYINPSSRSWIHSPKHHPRRAGVNAFGFGGINCHVILEEVLEVSPAAVAPLKPRPIVVGLKRECELLVFSGSSAAEIIDQLTKLQQFILTDRSGHRLEDIAYTLADDVELERPCKLALIAESIDQLSQLIAQSIERLKRPDRKVGDKETIYYSDRALEQHGRLALTFPGMGFPPGLVGAYPERLLQMCMHFPDMRREFDIAELRDEHPEDPVPTSAILVPPPTVPQREKRRLRERFITQKLLPEGEQAQVPKPNERNLAPMGVTLSNWVSWVLLRPLEIHVDMLCGQSQGDLAALCVAGATKYENLAERFWESLAMPATYTAQGHLALVGVSAERLAPFLEEIPDVDIAIHAGQSHMVLGGTSAGLKELAEKLKPHGVTMQNFPYPPIHTPRLSYMKEEVCHISGKIELESPKIPIYCSTSAELFPSEPEKVRKTLMDNFDQPVLWWQTYRKMYDDGARIFLQAGGTVANNVERIIIVDDLISVAVDVNYRDPVTQLNHVCATLFTCGCRFHIAPTHRNRDVKKLALDHPQTEPRSAPMEMALRLDPEGLKVEQPAPRVVSQPVNAEATPAVELEFSPPEDTSEVVTGSISAEARPLPPADRFMPLVGEVLHFVPGEEIVVQRRLSLGEDCYLADHHFIHAADYKHLEECFPVMPMTMAIEMISEIASCLAPGLQFIGLEDVRATRWLALEDSDRLLVQGRAKQVGADPQTGVHSVQVELFAEGQTTPSTCATVLFGPEYRQDVELGFTEIATSCPWWFTVEEVYSERHMFHGPLFQCITGLGELAETGCIAELTVPSKAELFSTTSAPELLIDPCVMDAVGQLLGCWVLAHYLDTYVLPVSVDKVEVYGPAPPAGTRVPVRIEITHIDFESKMLRADVEVGDGEGFVWMRFSGWSDRIFNMKTRVIDVRRRPERYCIAMERSLPSQRDDQLCTYVTREFLRDIPLDWIARLYLHSGEMCQFRDLEAHRNRQREWLMGRIAAKDAVRLWIASQSGSSTLIHPSTIVVRHDGTNRPRLEPIAGCDVLPEISISHSGKHAVAVAGALPAGIDIEPASQKSLEFLDQFATAPERELLAHRLHAQPEESWATRLWCAKEAVGKALGTGLQGRPGDFEAVEISNNGQIQIHHKPTAENFTVDTDRDEEVVLAFAMRT